MFRFYLHVTPRVKGVINDPAKEYLSSQHVVVQFILLRIYDSPQISIFLLFMRTPKLVINVHIFIGKEPKPSVNQRTYTRSNRIPERSQKRRRETLDEL